MSKAKVRDPDISDEYDFSRAKRGVYLGRVTKDSRVHVVTDDEDRARRGRQDKNPKKDR